MGKRKETREGEKAATPEANSHPHATARRKEGTLRPGTFDRFAQNLGWILSAGHSCMMFHDSINVTFVWFDWHPNFSTKNAGMPDFYSVNLDVNQIKWKLHFWNWETSYMNALYSESIPNFVQTYQSLKDAVNCHVVDAFPFNDICRPIYSRFVMGIYAFSLFKSRRLGIRVANKPSPHVKFAVSEEAR